MSIRERKPKKPRQDVAWVEGEPKLPGLYLVAIELGKTTGYFTFCNWTGKKWDQTYPEKVVAYCIANQFLASLHLKWPGPDDGEDEMPEDPNFVPTDPSEYWEVKD